MVGEGGDGFSEGSVLILVMLVLGGASRLMMCFFFGEGSRA